MDTFDFEHIFFYGPARAPFYSFVWVFETLKLYKVQGAGKASLPRAEKCKELEKDLALGMPSMPIWPWLLAQKR